MKTDTTTCQHPGDYPDCGTRSFPDLKKCFPQNANEWIDGYNCALEDAARFIEENVQTMTDPRTMMPRRSGNRHGIEYAEAIRAMKGAGL